jgi:hypothetical protein
MTSVPIAGYVGGPDVGTTSLNSWSEVGRA